MTTAQEVIATLSDPTIEALLEPYFSDIDTVAAFLGIDEGYLSVQLRLMLPQYTSADLHDRAGVEVVREVLSKLRTALNGFEHHYKLHRERNGIDVIPRDLRLKGRTTNLRLEGDSTTPIGVSYHEVEAADGFEIQDEIHYIHQARRDTAFHRGLFVEGYGFPICYCALSPCDREYQRLALSKSLGTDVDMNQVAVMTRAYGYSPLPKNMMSKLFDLTARDIARDGGFDYIITALNPFLGFSGSIFLGASYQPFARSPLVYHYTKDGLYANRRRASDQVVQQYATPPIVWLVRELRNSRSDQRNTSIVDIREEDYANG